MIEYEKRAMIEAEDKYTFRQSTQISMQTGLIGHLRADMDTDGNGFFSSWFDFREELKTDEFKAEFDDVINSLREEGDMVNHWGTLISNRPIRLEPRPDGRNAYRDIDPENDWNYEGTLTTVKEYMEKNPPAVHKQKDHEPAR